jgi:tRNA G10  N-methylase Trm11
MKKKTKKSSEKKIKKRATKKTFTKIAVRKKAMVVREPEIDYQIKLKDNTKRQIDESWDFRDSNTKEYTHCFHSYPAMMIPQVARRILDNFGNKSRILFDPYCGTGTSLVEANLKGINAIGTDINPLARLIATAKTTKIDIQVLDLFLHDFMEYSFSINFRIEKVNSTIIPQIKNIDFWFSRNVQKQLGILLSYIENINDVAIKNFFKVAFSETVRETSYVKPGEFKLVRRRDFNEVENPDIFGIMIRKLSRNKQGLTDFEKSCKNDSFAKVCDFNSVISIPDQIVPPSSVDIIVTSPPYGDSRTTVAYGQYSRLANEWLGYPSANQIDNMLMGGKQKSHTNILESDVLNDVIHTIRKKDEKRARDVISFYEDYQKSINNVSTTVKTGGYACYVVGNRTVKGINIPTDVITAEIFEQNNFVHIETIVRNIPNKRMPLRNSPSNVAGETALTMKNEYIVICQKR